MRKFYVLICIVLSPILLLSQNQLGANFLGDTFEDLLGTSVAISNDGSRIAMGGRGNSTQFGRSGIVKVMDWNGSAWVQAGSSIYGDSIGHEIGHQVALSGDGNVLILSSIRARGSFRFGDGFIQAYQWNGTSWNSMGSRIYGSNLEGFGFSISLSDDGTRLAVSSVSNSQIFGKVKVYEWNGTAWNQIGTTITGLNSGDWMGYDVSLSGDGQRLAVGTPNILVGSGQGAVDVYEWNLGVWNQLGSSLNLNGGGFEIATSLSYDGSTLAVGNAINPGNGNSGGIAKTYQWNGSSWVQRGNSLFGDRSQDSYGYQVSISGNGERLVVSALNHDLDPLNFIFETGQVKIYDWNGFGWQNIGNDIQGQVRHDSLGFALAVSGSGNRLIAGAPSHDHFNMQQARGMVKVFNLGAYVQRGIVRLDANNNCQADSNENVLSNVWIEIEKSNERRRVSTNSLGEYAAFVDTGSYVIKVDSRNYPYAYACPDSHLVQIDSQTTSLPNLDFVLEDSISCPYLTVDLTTPFIRRCFSSYYLIEYCNHGSEDLPSAVIEMELDPNFIFLGTNANLLNQNGQMLEFGVDSIKAGECKSIRVDFRENCLSLFGQVHCSSAHIYPDSLCVGSIPNVQLENFCLQDSLVIKLKNLADSFPNPLKYLIAESGLIIDSGNVSLGTNDSIFIYISNPDSSLAYQFILAPDDMRYYHASALLSCGPRPSSLQIAYPSRSMQAFSDIDCQNNLGSYDPNDKAAIPPAGDIPPDVPLAYTIRFQNTGTDTAFFINILDTLSQNLDVNTLEVQSASHPYEYEVLAQNPAVVRFRFDPIFLPDSTTDLEGSNGFVKFGIQMMPGLPLGSTIENKAAIYFDFNAPIITNTVVHTLAEPTVCSSNTAIDLISSCEPILWIDGQLYDSSTSEARFTLQDASGCDSMVQLNFTLTEINAEVEQQGQTFTAFEEGAEYQWVDCDNNYESIQGARARSYTLPHSEGHVAVIISKNGCQDTSECFQVINLSSDNWKADEIRVFPNPANASVSVDLGTVYSFADLDLYDLMGKHVVKKSYANKRELKMDLAIARGIYLLKISTSNGKAVMTRLIKE